MNHMKEHTLSVLLLVVMLFSSSCATVPIVDTEFMPLMVRETARGLANPYFIAEMNDVVVHVWPIASGPGENIIGWGVACAKGVPCPAPQFGQQGTFMTNVAFKDFMQYLTGLGFQVFDRAGKLMRTPIVLPVSSIPDEAYETMILQ